MLQVLGTECVYVCVRMGHAAIRDRINFIRTCDATSYSGTPLKWTPLGPTTLSAVARCP